MKWLKILGPVTTDYTSLTMNFPYFGHTVTLIADAPPTPTLASSHQLKRFAQNHNISALFHITPALAQPTPPWQISLIGILLQTNSANGAVLLRKTHAKCQQQWRNLLVQTRGSGLATAAGEKGKTPLLMAR